MSCLSVTEAGKNPWNTRGAIATGSVAAITLVVCGILAILVHTQVIALPSQLSATNLLIAGVAGGVFFTLLSLVIKYCCCRVKKNVQEESEGSNSDSESAKMNTGKKKNTSLDPDGKGTTGATGSSNHGKSFEVKKGKQKDLL